MNRLPNKFVVRFEDLSNEIIYEIFEYLDFHDIYSTFSKLNCRFHNLINFSTLPIKINISSMSKPTFQLCYTNIIIPYRHRINLLRITNPLIFDLPSSPLHLLSNFFRLQSLSLENIQSQHLENLLNSFISLPCLFSLVIISIDRIQDASTFYSQLFCLPVLKYCKLSSKEYYNFRPLKINNNTHSSIVHFVIDNIFHINNLNALLPYLPQLRRLSCYSLSGLSDQQMQAQPLISNSLTHFSLKKDRITFDQLQQLVTNGLPQLQVFHFSTNYNIAYLDANRWERLILSYMPNLRIFDIELAPDYNYTESYPPSIDQFMSSFWLKRQWFFIQEYDRPFATFYSVQPYRRKNYILTTSRCQETHPCLTKSPLHSVNHLSIQGNLKTNNDSIYFPNVTELSLYDYSNQSLQSIVTILDRMIPLTQLTNLTIDYRLFCIGKLVELLHFSPNIHTLTFHSISLRKISAASIQESQTFQTVLNRNKITNMIIKECCTLENMTLFINLCPRLEHLTINIVRHDFRSIMEFLLSENNINTRHLFSLCFSNTAIGFIRSIGSWDLPNGLPNGSSTKFISDKWYCWW